MLSPDQVKNREYKIGASFLPALMSGNDDRILNEWQRIVGDPSYVKEDLSDVWAVQLGSFLEPFALDWHEKKTGLTIQARGEWFTHPQRPHMGCHLDGYRPGDDVVIDCKVVGQWRKLDEIVSYYTPQMIAQRACANAASAALLVVQGGAEPIEVPVTWEPSYEALVWQRVDEFWKCVEDLTPPVFREAASAPIVPVKTYDMTGNNEWASNAVTWITTRQAYKDNEAATKALKSIIPADAIKCVGHGIAVSRSKSGALSIRENRE
jgi:predicted phage-related endonuclease